MKIEPIYVPLYKHVPDEVAKLSMQEVQERFAVGNKVLVRNASNKVNVRTIKELRQNHSVFVSFEEECGGFFIERCVPIPEIPEVVDISVRLSYQQTCELFPAGTQVWWKGFDSAQVDKGYFARNYGGGAYKVDTIINSEGYGFIQLEGTHNKSWLPEYMRPITDQAPGEKRQAPKTSSPPRAPDFKLVALRKTYDQVNAACRSVYDIVVNDRDPIACKLKVDAKRAIDALYKYITEVVHEKHTEVKGAAKH